MSLIVPAASLAAPGGSAFAAAEPAVEACTEAGVTWRVGFDRFTTGFGPTVKVTGLKRIENGEETDASERTWELRWERHPNDHPAPSPPPTWPDSYPPPFNAVRGGLTDVARNVVEYFSPRLVAPDGVCTVYLSPFSRHQQRTAWPKVSVLGDDLVHQLNNKEFNKTAFQGYVEGNLASSQIRVEVEGHTGARWTPDRSADPLDRSASHLLDEFRGLAEHDTAGTVMALGVNDALYVAGGEDEAQRDARLNEVTTKLEGMAREISSRTGCLQVVTAPENEAGLNPHYAAAARKINDWFRWVITAGGREDNAELVDFGKQARSHQEWFGPDGVHLSTPGTWIYTATLVRAALRCAEGVVLVGKEGTLDKGVLAGKSHVPSGQRYSTRAVKGWGYEGGKLPWFSTVADDGTIFSMTVAANRSIFDPSGEGMTVSAYHPGTNTFKNIKVKTDRGKVVANKPDGDAVGWDIGDIDAFDGGKAVAFTGSMLGPGGANPETEGMYPVLGILTKGAGGWKVAEGPDADGDGRPDWRNAWSSRELAEATIAADPENGPDLVAAMCPEAESAGIRVPNCFWFNELAVLPKSGDVAIAQYSDRVAVLKLDGPDAAGRYRLRIAGYYELPEIDDPSWDDPEHRIGVANREVQADPTSTLGDERFAGSADMSAKRYDQDGQIVSRTINGPVIEYTYDARTGKVELASAPFLSGESGGGAEPVTGLKRAVGLGPMHYDRSGNLWFPWDGTGTKVYAKTGDGRKFSRAPCQESGRPIEDYADTPPDARRIWGKICPADYNIRQPGAIGPVFNLLEDPATGNIVIGSWPHANPIVIEPKGSGTNMTFRVSPPASLLAQGVTKEQVNAPCPTDEEPGKRCNYPPALQAMLGPVDETGRAWFNVAQQKPGAAPAHPEHQAKAYDQWMYSVDLSRLMGREPLRLSATPGGSTVVQAELTKTFATTRATGEIADVDVTSVAPLRGCWPEHCTDPVNQVNGGYALGSHTLTGGTIADTTAEYRVVVPKGGSYQVRYRAADRGVTGPAVIRLTVDDGSPRDTSVTGGSMQEVAGPTISLSEGTHTIRVASGPGAHGWKLDWMTITRGS